tara:strand:- start:23 stop:619 length:597 start_codon:yes stop_codon:yes gene_type:complete
MAYFLGRDVKVAMTTEDEDGGITSAGVRTETDADMLITSLDAEGGAIFTTANTQITNPFSNVTGVDLTLGTVDEDIAYMGQRTALKAEIKKETTISLTLKKDSNFFDLLFTTARYGLNTAGTDEHDGLTQPGADTGYRFHVQLKASGEVITIPNCQYASKSVSLNTDGVTEETIEFISHVTPVIGTSAYTTATAAGAF